MKSAKWTARFLEAKGGFWCNLRRLRIEETVVVTVHAPAHVDLKDIESESPITVCGSTMVDTPKCQAMAHSNQLRTWYIAAEKRKEVAKNKHTVA